MVMLHFMVLNYFKSTDMALVDLGFQMMLFAYNVIASVNGFASVGKNFWPRTKFLFKKIFKKIDWFCFSWQKLLAQDKISF